MKKVLFPILAVVLALSLALPMAATPAAPAAANTTVEPVILYGTELGGTADTIYVIDVANGTATPVFSPNFDSHRNYVNGNAFDVENHRLYYASSAKKLYFYDFDDNAQIYAGSMSALAACAAFYDGKYYYIVQGTDDLRAISLNPADGKVASDTAIWTNFTGGARSFAFGDIAITAEGMLYGSTPTPAEFFSIDLTTPTYTQISTTGAVGLQLAYGCDDVLYGHKAGGDAAGEFYVVDPSDGSIGDAITTLNKFTDLASGPCLSIDLTKTGPKYAHEGDIITYTYDVHNDGDVPLENVSVTDDKAGSADPVMDNGYNVGDDDEDGLLDFCETWQFTADYEVLTPQIPDVENEATATAEYYGSEVSDTDTHIVDILHPAIEVIKTGPEHDAYFNGSVVPYSYVVTNTGDCDLFDVTLVDDNATPGDDTDDVEVVIGDLPYEGEPGTVTLDFELICPEDNYTYSLRSNVATAEGTDALELTVSDCDCWTVIIFQWQPRTIGYWGNWENHYTNDQMDELFGCLRGGDDPEWRDFLDDMEIIDGNDVHDFLLSPPPKGKMSIEKAQSLAGKQLLAAMLNVCAYKRWVGGFPWASADVGMDLEAIVYPCGLTVKQIIDHAAGGLLVMNADDIPHVLDGKNLLDMMNNAESNNYEMFVDPDFDHDVCLLTGNWDYVGVLDTVEYPHDMTIDTQGMDGSFSGTGTNSDTWTVTGTVSDSTMFV